MPRNRKAKDGIIHFERKLLKVGGSYAITVPKEWVESHDLKPGDKFAGVANSILTIGRKIELKSEAEGTDA